MSIQFSQGKLQGQERKQIIEEVQKQLQTAAVAAITTVLEAFLEAEVTAKLGREKGEPRRVSGQVREIDWACRQCGCRDANQFTRDGHYRRALDTKWGQIKDLRVPMLECQRCGHDVICSYTILEKYQRFWVDLDQQVLFGTGLCQSLRSISQQWSAQLESSVGLRTINERINQIEALLQHAHPDPITDVPPVVQFDGIWLRLQAQTETVKLDKRQRKRHERRGKKMVLLVALGFWSDGSGKREIVDWEVADGEGKAAWERLVNRLWERGVRPEKGLQAVIRDGNGELGEALALVYGTTVVEQRCLFHKLRNVADKCREDLKGKKHKEERKQLLEHARTIYQAESALEACTRLKAFADTWRARAPKAVATLERDFEQTIAYYVLEGIAREVVRTTSLLERTNRELRRKFRQACCFGSLKGAQVAIYLQVKRLNARWSNQTWWQTSQSLALDLLTLNP
jgi:putative transposase